MNKTKIEWVKNPDGSQGYTLNSSAEMFTGGYEVLTPEEIQERK